MEKQKFLSRGIVPQTADRYLFHRLGFALGANARNFCVTMGCFIIIPNVPLIIMRKITYLVRRLKWPYTKKD